MLESEYVVGPRDNELSSIGCDLETPSKRLLYTMYHKKGYDWCKGKTVGFDFDQEVFHEAYLCYLEDKQEEVVDGLKPPHHVGRSKFVAFMAGVFDQLSERKQANESTGLTTES